MRLRASIVIATLNRHQTLLRTLPEVLKQKDDFLEIVIIDQSDEIPKEFLDFVKKEPKIKFWRFSIKKLTTARNEGIKKAKGDIIIFLDDDSLIFPGLIKAHLENYKDPEVGAVTGREVLEDKPNYSTKGKGQVITKRGEIFPNTTSRDKGEVDSLWGANMSIKKDILKKIGGFDDDILLIRDETDVSLRIKLLGYKIIFEPKARIIHLQEKKGGTRFDKRLQWYFKFFHDEIYFQLKYFSHRYLWHFFWRKLRPVLACMFYYGKGHPRAIVLPFLAFGAGIKTYRKNKGSRYVPLRIGIDVHHLNAKVTGKEAYALGIVQALVKIKHTNIYFLYSRKRLPLSPYRFKWRISRVPGFLWYFWSLMQIKLDGIDVLFAPTSYILASLVPAKALPVVHDLAVFRKEFKSLLKARIIEKVLLKRVLRSKKVISISKFTALDLQNRFHLSGKIEIVYPGLPDFKKHPNPVPILKKYSLKKPYILSVGTVEPRKNFSNLILAYKSLKKIKNRYQLVIVGKKGWYADNILALAKNQKNIKFLGYVPREDLRAIFQEAEIFALPSKWEGFGLPVLEAFYFGLPVITSNVSSLPEVAREAALFVNPDSKESIKEALLKLIKNKEQREELAAKGKERLKRFSFTRSAKKLLGIFNSYVK